MRSPIFWLECSVRSVSGDAMGRVVLGWLVICLVGDLSL